MKRTGSIGSCVGPDVTSTRLPASGSGRCSERLGGGGDLQRLGHAAETRFAALGHLAGIGTDDVDAVGASCARLRCVALAAHMRGFIAGASRIGLSVASSTAVARSSAWPPAILAIRSAVAGATTMRSVSRASRIWPTSNSLCASNKSVIGALAGERAGGERRDEMLRGLREDAAHAHAAVLQAADEIERLIGGDAAADDEKDALACRRCGAGAFARRLRGRLEAFETSRPASSAASRRMTRTSSSIERPCRAARRRSSFLSLLVKLADGEAGHRPPLASQI